MIGYLVTFAIVWFIGSAIFVLYEFSEHQDNQKYRGYRHLIPTNKRRMRYGIYSAMLFPVGGLLAPAGVLFLIALGTKKVFKVAFEDEG